MAINDEVTLLLCIKRNEVAVNETMKWWWNDCVCVAIDNRIPILTYGGV